VYVHSGATPKISMLSSSIPYVLPLPISCRLCASPRAVLWLSQYHAPVSNEYRLTKRWNHTNVCDINTYLTTCVAVWTHHALVWVCALFCGIRMHPSLDIPSCCVGSSLFALGSSLSALGSSLASAFQDTCRAWLSSSPYYLEPPTRLHSLEYSKKPR
jgi:hypothetical protein